MKNFNRQSISYLFLVIILITCGFFVPQTAQAQTDNYPKLANYFLKWDVNDKDINELVKWDIVILSPQALERNPQVITKLKQQNPQIKILAYILLQEININPKVADASKYYQQITNIVNQNDWWLKTNDGNFVNWWPETQMINLSINAPKTAGQNWADYLPTFVNTEFLTNSNWDGVFYDNAWKDVSWLKQPIDANRDGLTDETSSLDSNWQAGINQILNKTRELAPDKLIVANANSNIYNNVLNGRMQENFPASNEGGWNGSVTNYLNPNLGYTPKYFIINKNTRNAGSQTDYRDFRFGLTSTLLGEGYYSYDFGDTAHENTWWYDEYNFYLGKSVSSVKNLLDETSQEIKPGVWKREFQNGVVLVNSTGTAQKVTLSAEYEKIKGTQDKNTNNGAIVRTVSLQPYDGLVLLRRIEEVINTPFYNGTFARPFNKYGAAIRNGFFIYEKDFKGGNMIAKKDINSDGQIETVVADASKIVIYDSAKNIIQTIYPYGNTYNKGINFSLNDYENDGQDEILTGTLKGGDSLIKLFNLAGQEIGTAFYAYAKSYKGGVNVALCELNGKGNKEIVTGTGFMGGPQVRIFDKDGKVLSGGFFAYGKTFRGGVNIACGDIDGNGMDEIITGAGYGGSSHVRIFNSKFEALNPGFMAFGSDTKTGVRVIATDLDGDGKKEILASSPDTFTTVLTKPLINEQSL